MDITWSAVYPDTMSGQERFYVYVYFDPRTYRMFYVGKGSGSRKDAHFSDPSDSEKTRIIEEIRADGVEAVVRVIAKDLTKDEALLIESVLIWEHYDELTNVAHGHNHQKFRTPKTLHRELPEFDYINNIYYVNVGEGDHRNWDDCRMLGFLCAGGDPKWSEPLTRLRVDDVVVAYLKGHGYVGIGTVTRTREKAIVFKLADDSSLSGHKESLVQPGIFENSADDELAQYCVGVRWKAQVPRNRAAWAKNSNLFTTPLIVVSLLNQPKTIEFVSEQLGVQIRDMMK